MLLRAGALPAPLTILEERTVGPGLGADSIKDGELSCLVGIAIVAVFMVLFYGGRGLLYWFGAGPVKGFAVTLSLGVVTSLFSALLVTRLMIITWLRQTRPKVVPI